jgi:acyl-CoA synthetase (AMP-forming)/AMP-acid ligase II
MRIIDFFDRGADRFPNVDVVHDGKRGWTYAEMQTLTRRVATALVAAGLGPSSAVATFTPNSAMGFAAQYGVFRAGAVWLPINVRNSVDENIAVLDSMRAEWLFFSAQYEADIPRIKADLPRLRGVVCLDGKSAHGQSLEDWIEGHGGDGVFFDKGPLDIVAMLTTSGTTGKPKGVELSQLTWESMIAAYHIAMPYDTRPIQIVAAPLTHAAGCLTASLLSLGCTNVLLPKPDPLAILEAIDRFKATTVFMPPTLIYLMLAHPRAREFDYSSLRYFLYGAAPMAVQKLREATDLFGPVMCQTYGQTEALMSVSFMSAAEHQEALANPALERRLWSAGRAGPLAVVGIMDDTGRLLPPEQRGEIVVRGNILMARYFDNPEATAEAGAHGWHHTGDIGLLDKDGYLYIVDRKKDLIITGGFNVYPGEVEQVIWTHPAVQDCAVIGIPDEKWGEAVTAVVELKPGATVDPDEIIRLTKEKLGSVKAPKSVIVIDALPRSPVGKVLKRELRDRYWQGRQRAI